MYNNIQQTTYYLLQIKFLLASLNLSQPNNFQKYKNCFEQDFYIFENCGKIWVKFVHKYKTVNLKFSLNCLQVTCNHYGS